MNQSSNVPKNDHSINGNINLVTTMGDDEVALFKSCNDKSVEEKIAKASKSSNAGISKLLSGCNVKDNKDGEIVYNNHNRFNIFFNKDRNRQRCSDTILTTKDQQDRKQKRNQNYISSDTCIPNNNNSIGNKISKCLSFINLIFN